MNRKKKKLKVFHGLVNYGTQAGFLAKGLRSHGVEAISVTFCDQFKRLIDVELKSGGNAFHKLKSRYFNWAKLISYFFKYNTFHFYFGTSLFPKQIDLPLYKFFGKKVVMEYLGYDVQLYEYSLKKYEYTNVKYYKPHDISLLADKQKIRRLNREKVYIDQRIVCAPYLSEFVSDSIVLPLAIDLKNYKYCPKDIANDKIVIMHAPTDRNNKGSSFILQALKKLKDEGYNIEILFVENLTHAELKIKYLECDIFVDQILAGWYGTASIEAMALGRPTVCFIRESYFEYINYGPEIPIINANPSNIYAVIKECIKNKNLLPGIGKRSREFVEKIHDLNKLTNKLIEIYSNL